MLELENAILDAFDDLLAAQSNGQRLMVLLEDRMAVADAVQLDVEVGVGELLVCSFEN